MTNNAKKQGRLPRPTSDSVAGPYKTPEAQGNPLQDKQITAFHSSSMPCMSAIDKWFEDLSLYEGTMSQLNSAPLDEAFKEELKAIQQWFNVLSEQERMTALFSLLKNLSIDQVRFFMTLLQLMISKDMVGLGVSMHQHPASQGGNEPMSKSAVEPIMPKLNKKGNSS